MATTDFSHVQFFSNRSCLFQYQIRVVTPTYKMKKKKLQPRASITTFNNFLIYFQTKYAHVETCMLCVCTFNIIRVREEIYFPICFNEINFWPLLYRFY